MILCFGIWSKCSQNKIKKYLKNQKNTVKVHNTLNVLIYSNKLKILCYCPQQTQSKLHFSVCIALRLLCMPDFNKKNIIKNGMLYVYTTFVQFSSCAPSNTVYMLLRANTVYMLLRAKLLKWTKFDEISRNKCL